MIVDRLSARRAWPLAGGCHREEVAVATTGPLEFVDVTSRVLEVVARSSVLEGLVSIQSLHTTAAVIVNEGEPLLLEDLRATLERAAPRRLAYLHDEMDLRTGVPEDEPINGHAHCKALFLRASETLAVAGGIPRLGRWQRVFLVELDGPRTRMLSLTVLG
jgi:secondary thiamine-phosphate synthase enzyme